MKIADIISSKRIWGAGLMLISVAMFIDTYFDAKKSPVNLYSIPIQIAEYLMICGATFLFGHAAQQLVQNLLDRGKNANNINSI